MDSNDSVTFEVDFEPNMAILVQERLEAGDDVVVGDLSKKSLFGLPRLTKLKKKLSKTNKKIKGKSKMASLLKKAAAIEPSKALKWKTNGGSYQNLQDESSGSLFAGRLEEDTKQITNLPTIPETSNVPSSQKRITQNHVVEERTSSKKQLKRKWKRFLKKFKKQSESTCQASVADTASTTSSPRINTMGVDVTPSADAVRDDTEVALASVDETFYSVPSSSSSSTTIASNNDVILPPSLALVRQTSSPVARPQASVVAKNVLMDAMMVKKEEAVVVDHYPSDEEACSVDSIVSPVPSTPPSSPPRKKILNYKKVQQDKKKKTSLKKNKKTAPIVATIASQTTTAVAATFRWNVWALVLAAALVAFSVWQRLCLPQKVAMETASLVNTNANISYFLEAQDDGEWPFDECCESEMTPVVTASFFDELGVMDCSY